MRVCSPFSFLKQLCMLGGGIGLRHWKANLCKLLLLVAVLCPVCISTVSSRSRAFPWLGNGLEGNLVPCKFSSFLSRRARRFRGLVLQVAPHAALGSKYHVPISIVRIRNWWWHLWRNPSCWRVLASRRSSYVTCGTSCIVDAGEPVNASHKLLGRKPI